MKRVKKKSDTTQDSINYMYLTKLKGQDFTAKRNLGLII